jgi:hypothetical protein
VFHQNRFAAEPAADERRDHLDGVRIEVEDERERIPVSASCCGVEPGMIVSIPGCDGRGEARARCGCSKATGRGRRP